MQANTRAGDAPMGCVDDFWMVKYKIEHKSVACVCVAMQLFMMVQGEDAPQCAYAQ